MRKKILGVGGKSVLTLICLSFILAAPQVIAGGVSSAQSQKQDSLRAERLAKVAAFRQAHPSVQIATNPANGVPTVLDGDLSPGLSKSDPVEAAYEFFEINKELFGMVQPHAELQVKGTSKDRYGGTVAFKQIYRGVDVYQGVMYAHFTPSGHLKFVNGEFYPDIDLSTTPSIDSSAAVGIAKRDLNYTDENEKRERRFEASLGSNRAPVNASLVVAYFQDCYHLIWVIDISGMASLGGAWVYWVEAHTGAILSKASALMDGSPSPVPITPVPKKGRSNPQPGLKKESQDSTPKPKQIEGPRSESPIEPIPLSPENFGEIPVS